ncbi:MAG: endolytic transglycosylase MltG, partial [Gammaproteobacteria bacterium]
MSRLFNKGSTSIITTISIMLLIVALLIGIYYVSKIYSEMNTALILEQPETIIFSKGSSTRTLVKQLMDKNLLKEKYYFLIWGKLKGQDTRLQAGEYSISPGSTLADLLDDMASGNVVTHSITLIEGNTFRQALDSIQQNPVITKQLIGLSDEEIMTKLGRDGEHPEGRFYPDTYHISHGVTDTELLSRAYDSMQKILEEEWQQREAGLPFKSSYEALILASIVEKESAVAEERPLIAGLFINRLRKKMRLQTDPTVIYGIENYDGNIRFRDLRKDTPYNTYTRYGLPPTPIALPGREAINATLHPDKTKYLYFVAYGDGSGRHVFSTNLKDHEKA